MEKKWSCLKEVHRFNKRRRWYLKLLPFFLGAVCLALSFAFKGWIHNLELEKYKYEHGNLLMENELLLRRERPEYGEEAEVGWQTDDLFSTSFLLEEDELDALGNLEGVQSILPYFIFQSSYNMYHNNPKSFFSWRNASYPVQTFTWLASNYQQAAGNICGEYKAVPYLDQEQMDKIALAVDVTAENGAYLSETMAEAMGIDTASLDGLIIRFEICPPICLQEFDLNGTGLEEYWDSRRPGDSINPIYSYQVEYGNPVTITIPVRGILPNDRSGGSVGDGSRDILTDEPVKWVKGGIALPYQTMNDIVDEHASKTNFGHHYLAYQPISYLVVLDSPENADKAVEQLYGMKKGYRLSAGSSVNYGMLFWLDAAQIGAYIAVILLFAAAALFAALTGMRHKNADSFSPKQFSRCRRWGAVLEALKMLVVIVPVYLAEVARYVVEIGGLFSGSEFSWEFLNDETFWTFLRSTFPMYFFDQPGLDPIVLFSAAAAYGLALAVIPIFLESRNSKRDDLLGEKWF